MQKQLINASLVVGMLAGMFLSGCSSVKELTNANIWPFGSSSDAPRIYLPVNSIPYLCEGNKKFHVRMLDKGASAWLILPDREVLLSQSGSAKVYSNGISKLDLTNEVVTLDVNDSTKYVACKANGVAKVAKLEANNSVQVVKSQSATEPQTKPKAEKSWFNKLKFWESDDTSKTVPANTISDKVKAAEPAVVNVVETVPAQTIEPKAVVIEQVPVEVAPTPQAVEDQVEVVEKSAGGQVVDAQVATVLDNKVNEKEAVMKALETWANAWRTKNTDVYLSAYSPKFKPQGISQKTWLAQRKERVGEKSAEITLVLDQVNVVANPNKAEVKFIQHYTSGKFSDSVAKVLRFENENGHWLIVKEIAKPKK